MNNHEFNTIKIADGTDMELYAAFPEGNEIAPSLLVIQEAFGVNYHIRDIAERFCREEYAVVSPDLFHRTGKRLEISYSDFSSAMPHLKALTKKGLSDDVTAAYNWLQQQNNVDKDKAGCIGFCLGGRVSFLANAMLPLSAAVSYYGGGIEQIADEAPNLHGPHLFYWGGKDQHILQDNIDQVIKAVKDAGKDYTNVVISYADHGFNCDARPSYHPLAAKEAWAHTLAFFANRLK